MAVAALWLLRKDDFDYEAAFETPSEIGDSGGPLIRTSDNAALGIASRAATFDGPLARNGSLFYDLGSALRATGTSLVVG